MISIVTFGFGILEILESQDLWFHGFDPSPQKDRASNPCYFKKIEELPHSSNL